MTATDEGPLPDQTIAAFDRYRLTTGSKRCCYDGIGMTLHDLSRALVGQPSQKAARSNRELQIPPSCTVMARYLFNDAEDCDRVYL
jgi:hypothetical protein